MPARASRRAGSAARALSRPGRAGAIWWAMLRDPSRSGCCDSSILQPLLLRRGPGASRVVARASRSDPPRQPVARRSERAIARPDAAASCAPSPLRQRRGATPLPTGLPHLGVGFETQCCVFPCRSPTGSACPAAATRRGIFAPPDSSPPSDTRSMPSDARPRRRRFVACVLRMDTKEEDPKCCLRAKRSAATPPVIVRPPRFGSRRSFRMLSQRSSLSGSLSRRDRWMPNRAGCDSNRSERGSRSRCRIVLERRSGPPIRFSERSPTPSSARNWGSGISRSTTRKSRGLRLASPART